jgi:hypothetical protein
MEREPDKLGEGILRISDPVPAKEEFHHAFNLGGIYCSILART